MATLSQDMKNQLHAGYDSSATGAKSDAYYSSAMWEAFTLGAWLHNTGRTIAGVEKGRGDTYKSPTGAVYRFKYFTGGKFSIEREQ